MKAACCDYAAGHYERNTGACVELVGQPLSVHSRCPGCGRTELQKGYRCVGSDAFSWADVRLIDIEEGQ